jgi:hypothetical protein
MLIDDILIVGARGGKNEEVSELVAYRIAPTGATKLWELDPKYRAAPSNAYGFVDRERGIIVYKSGNVDGGSAANYQLGQRTTRGWHHSIDYRTGAVRDAQLLGNKGWATCNHLMGDLLIDSYLRIARVDAEGKLHKPEGYPEYTQKLKVRRYTCTTSGMADGRVFIRLPYGIVCMDLRNRQPGEGDAAEPRLRDSRE